MSGGKKDKIQLFLDTIFTMLKAILSDFQGHSRAKKRQKSKNFALTRGKTTKLI